MNNEILTGFKIAEYDNKNMRVIATINDLEKQKEVDQKAETNRTVFRRERDRILYSGGFRRLQDKTQVIAAVKTGDHRTRLTHSLEVEQIAISIADALKLNIDLTSAIALGHDIGHTPFGHAVERFLNDKLIDEGGFSHALESLRYLHAKDMNLSKEIIEGILKHDTDVFVHEFEKNGQLESKEDYYINEPPGTLEAQIVYWADKIAYITHDYEDFVKNNLLLKAIKDNRIKEEDLKGILSKLIEKNKGEIDVFNTKDLIRDLVRKITGNLITSSNYNIKECFKDKDLEKCKSDKTEKQKYIRETTMNRVKELYSKNREREILKELNIGNKLDEYIEQKIIELYKFYESENNEKMMKEIDNIKLNIIRKLHLEEEIKKMSNIEIIEKEEKINDYKKLCNMKINIFKKRIKTIEKESYLNGLVINLSNDFRKNYLKLRKIIDKYYIGSSEIQLSDAKAEKIVSSLFDMFINNSNILPNAIKDKIEKEISQKVTNNEGEDKQSLVEIINKRNIASYIASMSDRYAEEIYMDLNSTGSHYDY